MSSERQKFESIIELLEEARIDISKRLDSSPPNGYLVQQLRWNLYDIDCAKTHFANRIGAAALELPRAPEGLRPLGRINKLAVEIAQDHIVQSRDGITAEMAREIEHILRRAQLGGQHPNEIVQQVGRVITGGTTPSVFTEAGKFAEKIAIYELHEISEKTHRAEAEMYARRGWENAPGPYPPGAPEQIPPEILDEWTNSILRYQGGLESELPKMRRTAPPYRRESKS